MAFNFNNLFKSKKKKTEIIETSRYTFTKNLLPEELIVYKKTVENINKFWRAFVENEEKLNDRFKGKSEFDIVQFINSNLQVISPYIMWEFGHALDSKGHRLVLSSESRKYLRPLVELIIEKAPVIDNWEFYSYRPLEDFKSALQTVAARTQGNLDNLFFQIYINEYNQIDLFFVRDTCKSDNDFNQTYNEVFVALETLIGEENLDKWIGLIDVNFKHQKDNNDIYPIEKLQEYVINEITKMKLSMPVSFYYERWQNVEWGAYEIENVENAANYSDKKDMITAISMDFKLTNTILAGVPFYSERFSTKEIFCYLKIDNLGVDNENSTETRAVYEDKLNEVLISNALGCTIGGGTGYRYAYIDFALADFEEGIHAIRAAMIVSKITKKAWIQFPDLDKKTEWIGIYNDTPIPFMD